MRHQPVRSAQIRIVTADPKLRIDRLERAFPAVAKSALAGSGRIVEKANIGLPDSTVHSRDEAVHSDVEHATPAPNLSFDPRLDRISMREIMLLEQRHTLGRVQRFGELRKQSRVTHRAIEVDQKPCHHAGVERNPEGSLKGAGQRQRADITASMARENPACCGSIEEVFVL
jgi:hypothetical protein